MTASDTPSLVLRNTSLTMRQRFTPARSCSTWTRICANFRLVRFSAAVSSPRGGFFFRLAGLLHWRLIALKRRVLVQGGPGRIAQLLLVGYPLVVGLAGIRPTQEQDLLVRRTGNQHVLVCVRLLLAAVVEDL